MADTAQGQAPNESAQAAQSQTAENAQTGQEPEAERFDAAYVQKLRAEAAEHRRKLRDFEAAAKAADDAKLSETERTNKRLAELERQHLDWQRERQELTARYAIEREAARLGIVDPDAAYRLLDPANLEFAEDGSPKDVDKALRALLVQRPYLAGTPAAASGAMTNPATASRGAGQITKSQVADRAFWNANKPAILQAMAEGRIVDG